jgi:cyclohexa-1,5-dienecarbonyl-CoA hydratase
MSDLHILSVTEHEGGARAALTFAHPKGNILTAAMVSEWRTLLADLALPTRARHIKLLTIEGAGADFCFGANIIEHAPDMIGAVLPDMNAFILDLLTLPMPTMAVVRGRCLGGGFEVALACDFIIAEQTATFGLPEIAIGGFAPIASVLLPRRVSGARAISALLTGRPRTAAEWHTDGLVERVVPDGHLDDAVHEWFTGSLGRWSAEALRHAVLAARADVLAAARTGLPAAASLYVDSLAKTQDAAEGVLAFLAKRAPNWTDS